MKPRNLLVSLTLLATQAYAQMPQAVPVTPKETPPTSAPDAAPGTLPPPASILPPPPPPMPLPKISTRQEEQVRAWLAQGPNEGLGISSAQQRTDLAALSGDALVRAALDRARALKTGRLATQDYLSIWALRPAAWDPQADFTAAAASNRLPGFFNDLSPPYAGYDGLKQGLETYQAIRAKGGWPILAASSKPGAVIARIQIEDPGASGSLVDVLQRTQKRYGLNPTGRLDANTLAALNVPVGDRVAAIMANMERWRWLPRELPTHRVQVNIAAAVLTVFEGDRPVTSMRAVTGRPGNETPMLQSSIHSVVVNPPWNVPSSIATKELWPKGRAAILAKGFKIVGTPPNERLVQPAGPTSALGRLKFDFDNPFAVYLHDTPSRGKFDSFDRLDSHGCVRLQKPVDLAELMLKDDPKLSGQVQAMIDTGKTQRVALPERVAVYLLYWTAFANANGTLGFRDDPYNWDKLLAGKIAASSKRAETATAVAMNRVGQ
ncbi:Peptidoglycan-binding protein [Sphingomonas antarctica]|uniref:L,D-transpeptidase family protein n=1 Tax=Sphingomonas antarctica TaxID=2040274 RepID=UPI0039ED6347